MDLPRFWIDSDGVPKLWVSTADRKEMSLIEKCYALRVCLAQAKDNPNPWLTKEFMDQEGGEWARDLIEYVLEKFNAEGCL